VLESFIIKPHLASIFLFIKFLLFLDLVNSSHKYLFVTQVANSIFNFDDETLFQGIETSRDLDSSKFTILIFEF
jgi:hypothetical protein